MANRRIDAGERIGPGPLTEMLRVFGLENLLEAGEKPDDAALKLLEQRESARKSKDFATADARLTCDSGRATDLRPRTCD